MQTITRLWIGLIALVLLSPLGLILPAEFGARSAWGEWSADEMQSLVGYVPRGMEQLSTIWHAPMPDYAMRGQEHASLHSLSVSYILSGLMGMALVVLLSVLIGRVLAKRENYDAS